MLPAVRPLELIVTCRGGWRVKVYRYMFVYRPRVHEEFWKETYRLLI